MTKGIAAKLGLNNSCQASCVQYDVFLGKLFYGVVRHFCKVDDKMIFTFLSPFKISKHIPATSSFE